MLLIVGHQFLLDRLACSSDLALVVGDGPAQLTRISRSRAICPGLDQDVSTTLDWDPVSDLGLLLQQQRLEILWHWRVRRGGSCVAQRAKGNLGTHAQSRQQDSDVEGTWQLRVESQ